MIKGKIGSRYGMLDLLDVFVEADWLVDFTRFFTHSGTREVRSREALRPLLILDLFGEATNMGIKQVANANDRSAMTSCPMFERPTSHQKRCGTRTERL